MSFVMLLLLTLTAHAADKIPTPDLHINKNVCDYFLPMTAPTAAQTKLAKLKIKMGCK